MNTPIRQLVGRLQPPISRFDQADGASAITGSGVGLDVFAGERMLASGKYQETSNDGYAHEAYFGFTDQRTCVAGWSSCKGGFNDSSGHVHHLDLVGVEFKNNILVESLTLLTQSQGPVKLVVPEVRKALGAFYEELSKVAFELRGGPAPIEGEFENIEIARTQLWREDDNATKANFDLLALSQNYTPEVFNNFVTRIVLDHRIRADGPAMSQGWWICPLSANDFMHCLVAMFGAPLAQHGNPDGSNAYDFHLTPQVKDRTNVLATGALLGVGAASVAGLAAFPFRGVGRRVVKSMISKHEVDQIRIVVGDGPHFSSYQIFAPQQTLSSRDVKLAHAVQQAIANQVPAVLSRRIEQGWEIPFERLMSDSAPEEFEVEVGGYDSAYAWNDLVP